MKKNGESGWKNRKQPGFRCHDAILWDVRRFPEGIVSVGDWEKACEMVSSVAKNYR